MGSEATRTYKDVTFANATTSDPIRLGGYRQAAVLVTSGMAGSAITLVNRKAGTNDSFDPVMDVAGADYTVTPTNSGWLPLPEEVVAVLDEFAFKVPLAITESTRLTAMSDN